MSIVGAEAVSLSDLMKLGPQALGAMAQGQTKSIAPSYMVLAALKALTDQQAGMAPDMPQGTVKDQVVAQAMPPQQAGIGAMAPQKFNQGGSVAPTFGQEVYDWFSQLGSDLGQDITDIGRGKFGRRRTIDEVNYGNEGYRRERKPAEAAPEEVSATPATRVGTEVERATRPGNEVMTPPKSVAPTQPQSNRFAVSASSTARSGIGGAGVPLQAKYAKDNTKRKPLSDIEGLAIPEDKYLSAAFEKFSKPDEKRMAELKEAERNAGLGALAKGILKGRGFGGAFGPAVADSFDAQEDKAKERRQYEDAREKMATELGLKKGSQERENFFKNTEFKTQQQTADIADQRDARDFEFGRIKAMNDDAFRQAELGLRSEANRIAAEVSREGRTQRNIAAIQNLYTKAQELAITQAEKDYGKTDFDPTAPMTPEMRAAAEKRQKEKRIATEQLMAKYIGELEARIGPLTNGVETITTRPGPVARDYTK
jgi:hypothetical protein